MVAGNGTGGLKELQDKYRTSASDILAAIPHDGNQDDDYDLDMGECAITTNMVDPAS